MIRILVIEDDLSVLRALKRALEWEGFHVDTAGDGISGYAMALTGIYSLVLLDLELPGLDGKIVLQRLRDKNMDLPVIILTAHSSINEMVLSFNYGASDFIAKPYPLEELMARIRVRLRERPPTASDPGLPEPEDGLIVNKDTHRVRVHGRWQDLSPRELEVLKIFRQHRGQVLSRRQLHTLALGKEAQPASNLIDVYVRTLRRKIGSDRFETVRGVGYRFN